MKTSDIDLNIDFSSDNKNDLQRTEEWFLQRNGEITSTTCKSLMACDNSGGKLPWNEKIKVYSFSSGIVKLVYEKAMQQKSGRYIDSGKGSYAMQYGTAVEPLILKAAKKDKKIKKLLKKGYTVEETGYKSFPNIPNAGASTDGIIRKPNGDIYAVIEMKACTSWATHYERTFDSMNDKNMDFWQTQAHIIAWDTKKCYYVVAEPPKDIRRYVFSEDIDDEWEIFKKEAPVSVQIIKKADYHCAALLERIKIVNEIVEEYLKDESLDLTALTYGIIDDYKLKAREK